MNFENTEILEKIKQAVKDVEPQAEVVLFGSRARRDEQAHSDWDILILSPHAVNLQYEQKFRHRLFNLALEYDQSISTFVYSMTEWNTKHQVTPLYQNVKREGIRL